MKRRTILSGTAALAASGVLQAPAIAQSRTRLTLYTSWETDTVAPFKAAFEADTQSATFMF